MLKSDKNGNCSQYINFPISDIIFIMKKTYIKMTLREVNKKVSLEPGMCIELGDDYNFTKKMILFKTGNNALCYASANNFCWDFLFQNEMLDKEYERIRVYTSPSSIVMFDDDDKVYDSCEKDNGIINVTLSDIAKLYGVSEDRIRIKARSESI